jgi:non-homologous end joining protein Ku
LQTTIRVLLAQNGPRTLLTVVRFLSDKSFRDKCLSRVKDPIVLNNWAVMLDLAKHIVTQKASNFEPAKFEDHYEAALTELINAKRSGKTIGPRPRPKGENVVDLMDALKKSLASEPAATGKKPRKASAGQKEMLLPIQGKKPAAKKAAKPERPAKRKAG